VSRAALALAAALALTGCASLGGLTGQAPDQAALEAERTAICASGSGFEQHAFIMDARGEIDDETRAQLEALWTRIADSCDPDRAATGAGNVALALLVAEFGREVSRL
jgi:hypothetical protein